VDRINRDNQHLALPTAAALVFVSTTGVAPDASKPGEMRELLNDIAHAISNVASIYASDPQSGKPVEINSAEMLGATFLRGAHLLITSGGKEYRGLTVQRHEMNAAILILKRARFAIRRAPRA
jgi:hypothetical protein